MSCSQLIEIEDLVLGTIEPARARELRVHVSFCTTCRREQAAVTKERALFMHRESAAEGASAGLAVALRARLASEVLAPATLRDRPSITGSRIGPARRGASRLVRRGASALVHVLRRGHVSAGCAALLFALVAFSKLGGAPILPPSGSETASSEAAMGPTASLFSRSLAEETLACTVDGTLTTFANEGLGSAGTTTQSWSSGATMREVLACGCGGERSGSSCEPPVICSSLRQ